MNSKRYSTHSLFLFVLVVTLSLTFTNRNLTADVTIRVAQETQPGLGDFDNNVLGFIKAYETTKTAAEYYNYGNPPYYYDGPDLPLVVNRAHFFFVNCAIDGLSLFIVYDDKSDGAGGRAEVKIELSGDCVEAERTVEDEPTSVSPVDIYTTNTTGTVFTSKNQWGDDATDGWVLSGIDGLSSLKAQFTEVDGDPATEPILYLTSWHAYSNNGSSIPVNLEVEKTVEFKILPSLIAYYPFNGSANDESGNGYHGQPGSRGDAPEPTLCEDKCGNANSAYCFVYNGPSYGNWINIPSLTNYFPNYTVLCWFKAESTPGVLLCKGRSGGDVATNFCISVKADGRIDGEHEIDGTQGVHVYSNTVVEVGKWYHMALTYNSTDLKLYLNGHLDNVHNNPGDPADIGRWPVDIGAIGEHDGFFDGVIDEVRIHSRALTECEIAKLVTECEIVALIDIDPDTLNTKSHGQWITAYITLPEGYNVADINETTIAITGINGQTCPPDYQQTADLSFTPQVGDRDEDGILDLTVKFDRQVLLTNLCLDDVEVTIEGDLNTGDHFIGTDTIRVIERGK